MKSSITPLLILSTFCPTFAACAETGLLVSGGPSDTPFVDASNPPFTDAIIQDLPLLPVFTPYVSCGELTITTPVTDSIARWAFEFSRDGSSFLGGGVPARVWDVATRREIRVLDRSAGPATYSPDGRFLAYSMRAGGVRLTDASTGASVRDVGDSTQISYAIAYSAMSDSIATSTSTGIERWNPQNGSRIGTTIASPSDAFSALHFTLDGNAVAAIMIERGIWVFDLSSGTQVFSLEGTPRSLASVAFVPDGTSMLTAEAFEPVVHVWRRANWTESGTIPVAIGSVRSVAVRETSAGLLAAVGTLTAAVSIVRMDDNSVVQVIDTGVQASAYGTHGIAFSPDGSTLATSNGTAIKLWCARP